jgi:hypothetical protein
MSRGIAIAACGVMLAACSSMPSMDIVGSTPATTAVQLESEPPGAEAKTSLGPACRTPCEVQLPASGDFSVTFSLSGYKPETVAVRIQPPVDRPDADVGSVPIPVLDPNPVYAELQRGGPAPRRTGPTKRPQTAARPAPPPSQQEPTAGPWPPVR